MKKLFLIIISIFCITGCGKNGGNDSIKEFKNLINKSKAYTFSGTMELLGDEETFNYSIEVNYLKDDYYKVDMTNTKNDHRQVILKNDEGLYLVTPSLNKSFKFESSWPDNSSQAYILSSLVNDIENDKEASVEKNIIKTSVTYPNNSDLKYQKIYLDDNFYPTKVEVFNENDMPKIIVNFSSLDLKANVDKKIFDLDNYIEDTECKENCEKNVLSQIENAIYPLYMPANTYLSASDIVDNSDNKRVILTFSGDKNFVIVEQMANVKDEHEVIPIYGEIVQINDTLAAMSNNSLYWTTDQVDYYLVSEDLSKEQMVFVASSLGNYAGVMATK